MKSFASTSNAFFDNLKKAKHDLTDFPNAEVAKARIVVISTGEKMPVQFNPQSLNYSGTVELKEKERVDLENPNTVNVYAKPSMTLTVELLFDATTAKGNMCYDKPVDFLGDSLKKNVKKIGDQMKRGSKVFPEFYGDVTDQIDFFQDIMTSYKKRNIEFAWNNLSFKGYLESISVSVTLFNSSGNPVRAKVNLTIKKKMDKEFVKMGIKKEKIGLPTTRK